MTASMHDRLRALGIAAGPILDLASEHDPRFGVTGPMYGRAAGHVAQVVFERLAAMGQHAADDASGIPIVPGLIEEASPAGRASAMAARNAYRAAEHAWLVTEWPRGAEIAEIFERLFDEAIAWLAVALVVVKLPRARDVVDATYADALRSVASR